MAEGEDHAAPGRAGSAQELAGLKSPGAGPLAATILRRLAWGREIRHARGRPGMAVAELGYRCVRHRGPKLPQFEC
jgi:hypothetical protein